MMKKSNVTLDVIFESALILFGNDDFLNKTRDRDIVRQRQICHYVAHKYFDIGIVKTGYVFGKKDHATVLHSCKVIANEIETYTYIKNYVNDLIELCYKPGNSPRKIITDILERDDIPVIVSIKLKKVLSLI